MKYCFVLICIVMPALIICNSLRKCRKSEEEGKAGQAKATIKVKIKAVAATLSPTKEDELSKQLKHQQHKIDALMEQVKNLVTLVRDTQPSSRVARTGTTSYGRGDLWKKDLMYRGRGLLGEGPVLSSRNHFSAQG